MMIVEVFFSLHGSKVQVVSLPLDHPVKYVQSKSRGGFPLLPVVEQLLPWPQEKETPSDRRVGEGNNGICLRRSLGSTEFTFTAALRLRERNLSLSYAEVDIDVAESRRHHFKARPRLGVC